MRLALVGDAAASVKRAIELSEIQSLGRSDFGLGGVRTISTRHLEIVRNSDGTAFVRAMHANPVRVLRGGDPDGVILSHDRKVDKTIKISPGDLIEIGDVRRLTDKRVWTYRFVSSPEGSEAPTRTRRATRAQSRPETSSQP